MDIVIIFSLKWVSICKIPEDDPSLREWIHLLLQLEESSIRKKSLKLPCSVASLLFSRDRQHRPEPTRVVQAPRCPSFRNQRTPNSVHLLSHNIIDKDGPLQKELLRVDWRDAMELLKEMRSLFHLKDIQKPHTYLSLQTREGFSVRYWTRSWEMRTLKCPVLFPGWLIQSSPVTIFGFIFEEHEKNTADIWKTTVKLKSNEWDQLLKKTKDKTSEQD